MFEKDRNIFIMPGTDLTPVWEAFRKQTKINKNLAAATLVALVCVFALSNEVDRLNRQIKRMKNREGENKSDD